MNNTYLSTKSLTELRAIFFKLRLPIGPAGIIAKDAIAAEIESREKPFGKGDEIPLLRLKIIELQAIELEQSKEIDRLKAQLATAATQAPQ